MNGSRRSLGPDGGMWQALAAGLAGWLAAGAARADLGDVRQVMEILFSF